MRSTCFSPCAHNVRFYVCWWPNLCGKTVGFRLVGTEISTVSWQVTLQINWKISKLNRKFSEEWKGHFLHPLSTLAHPYIGWHVVFILGVMDGYIANKVKNSKCSIRKQLYNMKKRYSYPMLVLAHCCSYCQWSIQGGCVRFGLGAKILPVLWTDSSNQLNK